MLEVPDAAVNQPRRAAGRPAREIVHLEQHDTKSSHGGVPGNAAARDAAADDDHVEFRGLPRGVRPGHLVSLHHPIERVIMAFGTPGRRVAIIAGVRTPFAKAGTVLKDLTAIDLGKRCVAELIQRTELDGTQVDAVIYGTVVPSVIAPNIAREVS